MKKKNKFIWVITLVSALALLGGLFFNASRTGQNAEVIIDEGQWKSSDGYNLAELGASEFELGGALNNKKVFEIVLAAGERQNIGRSSEKGCHRDNPKNCELYRVRVEELSLYKNS